MSLSDIDRKDKVDRLQKFMIKDIQAAIDGKANYLAALGLSTYTENLGGFLNGNFDKHNSAVNYTKFFSYFPSSGLYTTLDSTLKSSPLLEGLYKVVRCGLVHEYFMKADSQVTTGVPSPTSCGIVYHPLKSPQLTFYVDTYFDHFKIALKKYHDELLGIIPSTPPNSTKDLQDNFDEAYKSLALSNAPSGFSAAASGGSSITHGTH